MLTNADVLNLPLHKHIGLTLLSQTSKPTPTAHVSFTTKGPILNAFSKLHGGITEIALDVTCLIALMPALKENEGGAATITSSFQLIDAVIGEDKLVEIEAKLLRRGRNLAFLVAEAKSEGKLVATGMVTKTIFANLTPGETVSKL